MKIERLDQQYITDAEFQDMVDHAGRTRAAVRGFIKHLLEGIRKGLVSSLTRQAGPKSQLHPELCPELQQMLLFSQNSSGQSSENSLEKAFVCGRS